MVCECLHCVYLALFRTIHNDFVGTMQNLHRPRDGENKWNALYVVRRNVYTSNDALYLSISDESMNHSKTHKIQKRLSHCIV